MKMRSFTYLFMFTLSTFLMGCGEGASDVPEGTPPTPEAGSEDYDQYSNPGGNQHGPGGQESTDTTN